MKRTVDYPHRILSVTEEELSRIILDIHDGPVQYLFAALSSLTRIQHQLDSGKVDSMALQAQVRQLSEMIETSLREIKSFMGTFRPPEFHSRPLLSIIQGLVIQHEEWSGSTVELSVDDSFPNVSLPVKIAIYRILQEALSNAYRHAGVDHHWVHLWGEDDMICMTVIDKGKGFEPPPLNGPMATEREEHIGLRGMRDRVALLGGRFSLTSSPGEGTRVLVKVPANV
jgi:signal transduction histidine kinase